MMINPVELLDISTRIMGMRKDEFAAVVGGVPVPWSYLAWAALYSALYSTVALLVALVAQASWGRGAGRASVESERCARVSLKAGRWSTGWG